MYALTDWQLVRIHGRDPQALLQGQITADVRAIEDGQGTSGALCTPKGRMVANFGIGRQGEDFYLSVPRDRVDALTAALTKYLPFFGCEVAPLDWTGSGDVQPREASLCLSIGNGLYEHWSADGSEGQTGWAGLRIERNLPWVTAMTDQAFTPQQLNLASTGAVSFTKGCYTGQEVVARTEHLGKVKKFAHLVDVHGGAAGDLTVDGRKVGTLCHVDGTLGIAVLDPELRAAECPGGRIENPRLPYPITSPIKRRSSE